MTTSTSLVEFLLNLLRDEKALAEFKEDPEGYLSSCGISGLNPEDVRDAITVVEDDQDADHDRDTDQGGKAPAQVPPKHDGESDHESAVKYLNTYITNNYIDDRDTNVDNSLNQQIDTGGGDFDQVVDVDSTVVSGDGAVGAGGDITDSSVVTGNGNVVGDDNQAVIGNDNTTSFGEGDATSTDIDGNVEVGDGSGFNTGSGTVGLDNSDNSLNDVDNDYSDNSENGSNNDNSDNSSNNSNNDDSDNSNNSDNSDNSDNSSNNSNNDDSDNSNNSDNSDNSDNSVNESNNTDIAVV